MVITNLAVDGSDLIDSVVDFANAKLSNPQQVADYFPDHWCPQEFPKLRTCRDIQRDVRAWLLNPKDAYNWLMGSGSAFEVRLAASPRIRTAWSDDPGRDMTTDISWNMYVQEGSLRGICTLGVIYLIADGFADKTHECAHDKCNNLFVDTKSRGKPRLFCRTVECDAVRNREYVAANKRESKK
jgi:hypothetical protein